MEIEGYLCKPLGLPQRRWRCIPDDTAEDLLQAVLGHMAITLVTSRILFRRATLTSSDPRSASCAEMLL